MCCHVAFEKITPKSRPDRNPTCPILPLLFGTTTTRAESREHSKERSIGLAIGTSRYGTVSRSPSESVGASKRPVCSWVLVHSHLADKTRDRSLRRSSRGVSLPACFTRLSLDAALPKKPRQTDVLVPVAGAGGVGAAERQQQPGLASAVSFGRVSAGISNPSAGITHDPIAKSRSVLLFFARISHAVLFTRSLSSEIGSNCISTY